MKFGRTLSGSLYEPWRDRYIDYSKLKHLLREGKSDISPRETWTDDDEARFVEELLNVQLDKVKSFQVGKYHEIKAETSQCESQLEALHLDPAQSDSQPERNCDGEVGLREVLPKLDDLSNEINQLEKFSRINFTGFRKIIKKHDKRRGAAYKLRALLSSRLAELPLNTEDYSPLLYRLSAMYSFIRHHLQDEQIGQMSSLTAGMDDEEYDSLTYFIHPEDLIEVKTSILRHLPVLVYNQSTNSELEAPQSDPLLTSVYFDNKLFSLYSQRLERLAGASSLRIRSFGQLNNNSDVTLELKTLASQGASHEQRIRMKKKYVASFLTGEYRLQKQVSKLKVRGGEFENEGLSLEAKAKDMQNFVTEHKVQPLLRASYKRTAFQVPGDNAIRISIDTDLKFSKVLKFTEILNTDFDQSPTDRSTFNTTPLSNDTEGDSASDFPWAVLTIKLRGESRQKDHDWVHDLASSHLLREAPRFSKFVHGIAVLYEDSVAELPFWMSLIDTDIRRDPQLAFEAEQNREEQFLEEAQAVGSYGGTPRRKGSLHPFSLQTKQSEMLLPETSRSSHDTFSLRVPNKGDKSVGSRNSGGQNFNDETHGGWLSGLNSVFSTVPITKYARIRTERQELPPGVEEPKFWLKDAGPIKVEPKVWLANQRTFIKWQHVSVLLATLSLALYNSAGRCSIAAKALAVTYTIIAVLIAIWGWFMYELRSRVIRERSGKPLDNPIGPIVVSVSLGIALCINLSFRLLS